MKKDNTGNSMAEFVNETSSLPNVNKGGKEYSFG